MAKSTRQFNEPEFLEYDPTPYGGGYDPSTTYGKPLPPSDAICYPPSLPHANNSHSPPKSPLSPIPSPYHNQEDINLVNQPSNEGENLWYGDNDNNNVCPNDSIASYDGYGYNPWYGYDYSGYGGCGSQVPQPPQSEYIEPCASLFGYFPCLAKTSNEKSNEYEQNGGGCWDNEWKGTEEYFFGSSYQPYGYGEKRDQVVGYEEPNYAYQRHSWMEQPTYVHAEYNGQMWSQKLSYYENEAYQE